MLFKLRLTNASHLSLSQLRSESKNCREHYFVYFQLQNKSSLDDPSYNDQLKSSINSPKKWPEKRNWMKVENFQLLPSSDVGSSQKALSFHRMRKKGGNVIRNFITLMLKSFVNGNTRTSSMNGTLGKKTGKLADKMMQNKLRSFSSNPTMARREALVFIDVIFPQSWKKIDSFILLLRRLLSPLPRPGWREKFWVANEAEMGTGSESRLEPPVIKYHVSRVLPCQCLQTFDGVWLFWMKLLIANVLENKLR